VLGFKGLGPLGGGEEKKWYQRLGLKLGLCYFDMGSNWAQINLT
jgi:hypothetical protein